ncbi:Uncharacterised protein [uncultured archaeon]|nr:Uncharacterised protein [uncultured archaeon]
MEKKIALIIIAVIILIVFLVEFIPSNAPETIYIKVTKLNNQTPEENAFCKADIIAGGYSIENKPLEKAKEPPVSCYVEECANLEYGRGFYKLETGLKNYKGQFEIKIVCITETGVSYTILNNTHIPCEIMENGESVRC